VLTIVCGILLSLSALFQGFGAPFRNIAAVFIVPMQDGINSVGTWADEHLHSFKSRKELQAENEKLTERVAELEEENSRLLSGDAELTQLRELLKMNEEYSSYNKVGARVISNGGGNWYETFLINKGTNDGIDVKMNVLADNGLVGIVTDVGSNYARVRSIIEDESRVSAMVKRSGDTCIVKGNTETIFKDGMIDVIYISKDAQINEGEELVTSHISSKYLPGLRIGTVSNILTDTSNLTKSAKVTPVVDFRHLEYVLVITDIKKIPEGTKGAEDS
jgi:rod shape-determining protein MreC